MQQNRAATFTNPRPSQPSEANQLLFPKDRKDSWAVWSYLGLALLASVALGFASWSGIQNPIRIRDNLLGFLVFIVPANLLTLFLILIFRSLGPNPLVLTSLTAIPVACVALLILHAIYIEGDLLMTILFSFLILMSALRFGNAYTQEGRVPTAFLRYSFNEARLSKAWIPCLLASFVVVLSYAGVVMVTGLTTPWISIGSSFLLFFFGVGTLLTIAAYTRMLGSEDLVLEIVGAPQRATDRKPSPLLLRYASYLIIDGFMRSIPICLACLLYLYPHFSALIFLLPDRSAGMPALLYNRSWFHDFSFKKLLMFGGSASLGQSQVQEAVFFLGLFSILSTEIFLFLVFHLYTPGATLITFLHLQVMLASIQGKPSSLISLYQYDNRTVLSALRNHGDLAHELASGVMPQPE